MMSRYAKRKSVEVLDLWSGGKHDTVEIATKFEMRECDVERIIHADREARRRAAA